MRGAEARVDRGDDQDPDHGDAERREDGDDDLDPADGAARDADVAVGGGQPVRDRADGCLLASGGAELIRARRSSSSVSEAMSPAPARSIRSTSMPAARAPVDVVVAVADVQRLGGRAAGEREAGREDLRVGLADAARGGGDDRRRVRRRGRGGRAPRAASSPSSRRRRPAAPAALSARSAGSVSSKSEKRIASIIVATPISRPTTPERIAAQRRRRSASASGSAPSSVRAM